MAYDQNYYAPQLPPGFTPGGVLGVGAIESQIKTAQASQASQAAQRSMQSDYQKPHEPTFTDGLCKSSELLTNRLGAVVNRLQAIIDRLTGPSPTSGQTGEKAATPCGVVHQIASDLANSHGRIAKAEELIAEINKLI